MSPLAGSKRNRHGEGKSPLPNKRYNASNGYNEATKSTNFFHPAPVANVHKSHFITPAIGRPTYDTPCAASLPCNNPTCDDVVPCSEEADWCDPLNCLGDVCFDNQCKSDHGDVDVCFDELCTEGSRCISPCFSADCDVPACDAPCSDSLVPTCREQHRDYQYQQPFYEHSQYPHHGHGCIDPRCLDSTHHHALCPVSNHAIGYDRFSNNHAYTPAKSMGQNHWQSDHDFAQMLLQFNQEVPKQEPISRPTNYDRSGFSPFPLEQKPRLFTAPCTPRYPDIYCPTPDLTDSPSATPSSCFSADRPYQNMKVASSQVHTCLWCPDSLNPSAICGQTFCTAPDLHGHVEKAHLDSLAREDTLDNGFLCRWASCDRFLQRSFQARPKLKRHMQTHTLWKPFVCDVCGVQMKTKDAMDKHARTHTGERPYKCEEPGCDKIFATSTELKTHMVVHSGAKPHKCSLCNECFADSSNLSKHRKVHFVGAFRCPECGVRMKRWDQMRRHLVTQSHCLDLVNDPQRQQDYKMQMDQEFKSMPEALKTALPSGHPTLRHRHRA